MVDLVVTDSKHAPIASLTDFDLDLAFGSDENDFRLTCYEGPQLAEKALIGIEGTEYGGIIGKLDVTTKTDAVGVSYEGDTWHGMLDEKILEPDAKQDYLKVSGDANVVLGQLIARIALDGLFEASTANSGLTLANYQFERYATAYSGIKKMLESVGGKLTIIFAEGRVTLAAESVNSYEDTVDSDVMDFTLTRDSRRVNHLIGLGEGELKARAVSHWYADASGKVSQTQSLTGLDEVSAIYDYSSAKASELATETKKKLSELQGQGDIDVTVHEGVEFDIGDQVTGRDNVTGTLVSATVSKKIVKVNAGTLSVDYEVGKDSTVTSLSGTAESTPGGRIYLAGDGLSLADDGVTFNAEISQSDLDAVSKVATEAQQTASNFSAGIGALQESDTAQNTAIGKAQDTADDAKGIADTAVQTVTATAPLKATKTGTTVALNVTAATTSVAGTMSAADKQKLNGIAANANAYTLPKATTTSLGGVKPDGKTITISSDGIITAQSGGAAAGFLAAWPVGSIYQSTKPTNPGATYGGTWEQKPSLGAFTWERTA